MREILRQIREEPFLVNLMPHLIKFVESKSMALIHAEETVTGDVAIFNLIIQVLQAVYANRFFDSDSQLKIVIPILMNITLCAKFNKHSSVRSITMMKDFNAVLLSHLIEKFHQKYELKIGYAEFLLKQLLDDSTDEFCAYGCLACLCKFGPYINSKILVPQIPAITEIFKNRLSNRGEDAPMLTPERQEILQRNLFMLE